MDDVQTTHRRMAPNVLATTSMDQVQSHWRIRVPERWAEQLKSHPDLDMEFSSYILKGISQGF